MKTSALETIFSTFKGYKKYYDKIVPISVLTWSICIALIFFIIPFGFFASFVVMSILCIGLEKYNIELLEDKKVKPEIVFARFNDTIPAVCIKFFQTIISLFWSLLLIVPGIISMLNFAFTSHIFADNPKMSSFEVLEKSKQMTYGVRSKLFFLALFSLLMTVMALFVSCCLVWILTLLMKMPVWLSITIIISIFTIIFILIILPFIEISWTKCYLEVKNQTKTKKRVKNINLEKEKFDIITS